MQTLYELNNNTLNFLKDISGFGKGTTLHRIPRNADLAIQMGVPSTNLPDPLYSMPQNLTQLRFPVEEYDTPRFEGQEFDLGDEDHIAYIQECTELFTRELQALKNIDRLLEASFAAYCSIKIIQSFLSTRPYAGHSVQIVALQSMAMNAFNLTDEGIAINALFILLKNRQTCFRSYNAALQRLMHNMAWSIGYQENGQDANLLANNETLMQMVLTASEVLTLQQIQDIIADPIEPQFLAQARAQQNGAGYSARRQANTLALYGTKAVNPYYFVSAPIAWTFDLLMQNVAPPLSRLGLFPQATAANNMQNNNYHFHNN